MGGLLAPLVSARVDYQEAVRLGLGAAELNPHGVAAAEMRELWASVKRRLKKIPAARAGAKPAAVKAPSARAGRLKPAAKAA